MQRALQELKASLRKGRTVAVSRTRVSSVPPMATSRPETGSGDRMGSFSEGSFSSVG